jgi:hypothetical protein
MIDDFEEEKVEWRRILLVGKEFPSVLGEESLSSLKKKYLEKNWKRKVENNL